MSYVAWDKGSDQKVQAYDYVKKKTGKDFCQNIF